MTLQPRKEYDRWVHRFGILSNLFLLLGMLLFPVAISAIYGVWPDFQQLVPAFIAVVLFMLPWSPSETIGYMPLMGPGALYMSFITGNITNLRMPATVGTLNAIGVEPNTDACHAIATIACGASIITTVAIMALGVLVAAPLQPLLEAPALQPAFDYVVPAIFGGLVSQTILKTTKDALLYLVPLAVCLFFCYFTSMGSSYYMLIGIAASAIAYLLYYNRQKKAGAKETA